MQHSCRWESCSLYELLTTLESGSRPRGGVRGIQEGVPSIGGEHLTYEGRFDFSNIKYVPKIDWEWMFVIGIFIGAFISSTTSGSFQLKAVPDMWARRFGPGRMKRDIAAFFSGMVVMFGARLAGG